MTFGAVRIAIDPDTSPPPANEAVVASGVGPKSPGRSRHGAPDRKTQKMPLRTRRSSTRGTPRGFVRQHWLDSRPFIVAEFVAHDSSPRLRA
jgi:hypothetical protein